jgi:Zn-dependent protease
LKTLLILAAVLVILRFARPLLILNQLLRMRVWKTRARPAAIETVPAYVQEGLRVPTAELEALGLEPLGWTALEWERSGGDKPRFQLGMFHPALRAYATVAFSSAPDSLAPWVVTFSTFGADGRVVRTYGGGEQSVLGEPPGTMAVAPYAPTVSLQLQAHTSAVQVANVVPASLDHEAIVKLAEGMALGHFDSLVGTRALLPVQGGAYLASWPLAIRACRATLATLSRATVQRSARQRALRASLQPLPVIPLEIDVAAYELHAELMSGPLRGSFLAALFALTVPLFVVAAWFSTGAARTAAMVLGIVLFHELGHYLAMRALGYVDTTIFFVPFLGGVAAGRKDDATVAERMIVLLAGPLPGLAIAAALAHWGHPSLGWERQGLMLLAAINVFNLLPILPLDGGQIAHMLLFSRRTWLDVLARAVAGVSLVLLGWVASGIFLSALGVVSLIQLPRAQRQAELRRRFQEARLASPDETAVRLFFRVLRESRLEGQPFAQKLVLARTTLTQTRMFAPVNWRPFFGWLFAYGLAFAVGCGLVAATVGASAMVSGPPRESVARVPVASLSCRALVNADPQEPDPKGVGMLSGVAAFDTPETVAASRPRLAAAVPRAVFRPLGPVLFVWSRPLDYDDGLSSLVEETPGEVTRVAAAVVAAGGRFATSVAVDCATPHEASARSIDQAIQDYLTVAQRSMPIPSPWDSSAMPTEAEKVARRTFRVAMTAQKGARRTVPSLRWSFLLPDAIRSNNVRKYVEQVRTEQAKAIEEALAAERARGPIDEDVARIVVAKLGVQSPDERERLDDELHGRLGSLPGRHAGMFGLKSSHDASRVLVEVSNLRPPQIESELRPMLSWLCSQSCVDPRVLGQL